jgi:DNA-binding transcriptional MocR family regulator
MLTWTGQYLSLPLEGLTEYDAPQGYEPLRERAGEWLKSSGVSGSPLVTSGSQQALFLTGLSLLKPGDVVAVEDPCYRGAIRLFESLRAKILTIPHLSSARALDELGKANIDLLYTMPQGHFPTGLSIPDELRQGLLDLAGRKGFYIIEDDPVSELMGMRPLKAGDVSDRVIYIKSLSNILGPGLRIGFSVFPEALLDSVVRL